MKKVFIAFLLAGLCYSIAYSQQGYGGDGLGDHKQKRDLDSREFNILNPDLVDGVDLEEVQVTTTTNAENIADNKSVIEDLSTSSLILYYTDEQASSDEYWLMIDTEPTSAESTIVSTLDSSTVIVASFTVEVPLTASAFRRGQHHSHFFAKVDNASKDTRLRTEIYKGTGTALTFLFSTVQSNLLTTDKTYFDVHTATGEIPGTIGFINVRIVADVTGGGSNPVLTFYMEGANSSNFEMPALASDIGVTKNIAGTDIIISPNNGRGEVTINSDALTKASGTAITQNINDIVTTRVSTGTVNRPYLLTVGFTKDCDYICDGTDDHVQIQAALDLLVSSGALMAREGTFDLSNSGASSVITKGANISIIGQGDSTIFKHDVAGEIGFYVAHANCKVSNIQFQIGGSVDSVSVYFANADDCVIENCYFNFASDISSNLLEIASNSDRVLFINNRIYDSANADSDYPPFIMAGSDCLISGNIIRAQLRGIYMSTGDNNLVTNNRIMASTGIFIISGADENQIQMNNFEGCSAAGEIADAGANTKIRNNVDYTGASWLPETSSRDMNGRDITNVDDIAGNSLTVTGGFSISGADGNDGDVLTTDGAGGVTLEAPAGGAGGGFTTYYAILGGFIADIYKSTTVPVDIVPVSVDWILTGARAYTTYCSSCSSVIFEIRNTTGCYIPLWNSLTTVELSTNNAQSAWTNLSVDLDDDERVGLFVDFVSEIGGDLQVGAGVILRYHRKE